MTEPQVWVLIGVFAASMFGLIGIVTTGFSRLLRSEIGGLRAEIGGEIGSLRAEMNARFEGVDRRLDYLDRDVQLLMKREFGEP